MICAQQSFLTFIQSWYWDIFPSFLWLCYITFPYVGYQRQSKEVLSPHLAWWAWMQWGDLHAHKGLKGSGMSEKAHLSMGEDSVKAPSRSFLSPAIIYHFDSLGWKSHEPCHFLGFLDVTCSELSEILYFLSFLILMSLLLHSNEECFGAEETVSCQSLFQTPCEVEWPLWENGEGRSLGRIRSWVLHSQGNGHGQCCYLIVTDFANKSFLHIHVLLFLPFVSHMLSPW